MLVEIRKDYDAELILSLQRSGLLPKDGPPDPAAEAKFSLDSIVRDIYMLFLEPKLGLAYTSPDLIVVSYYRSFAHSNHIIMIQGLCLF